MSFGRLRVVLQAHLFKTNRLALEQRQQQFLRHRVVAVILLEDLQRMLARGVAQDDRIRLDLRGGAGVSHGIVAGLQVERHGVAHDGEVLVVNGERRLGGAAIAAKQRPASRRIGVGVFHGNFERFGGHGCLRIHHVQCRTVAGRLIKKFRKLRSGGR